MIPGARYGHTNLIAKDWRALARFYQEQFGCTPVPPERDFKGKDLERGTGIPGAELRGAHLRLPGHGAEGPTLEIFNYNILKEKPGVAVNRPGFGHIAFVVDDVPSARQACSRWRANGGGSGDADDCDRIEGHLGVCDRSRGERDRIAVVVEIERGKVCEYSRRGPDGGRPLFYMRSSRCEHGTLGRRLSAG
jgi:catechol 2,3-dioxygenase-like lactoylglutathione lyase family enzyme